MLAIRPVRVVRNRKVLSVNDIFSSINGRPRGTTCRPFVCWDCKFESRGVHGSLPLINIVCCQVQISASGWSPIQRSLIECGVSECDREASTLKRACPIRGCRTMGKNISSREVYTNTHTHIFRPLAHTMTAVKFADRLFPTETAAALRIQMDKFIWCLQIVSIVKKFR